jgi:uncharacterized repeat protein (TIGR03806 family)
MKIFIGFLILVGLFSSWKKVDEDSLKNNFSFKQKLSEYNIYQGKLLNLTPAPDFHFYEIATKLFSDLAEKQRLIHLPVGEKITLTGNGVPDLPNGTILVKTFFYLIDERDTAKGKILIETRLLIKSNSEWNATTYKWNGDQTDAELITTGSEKRVSWVDASGNGNSVKFHIPSNKECARCHNSNNHLIPLGFKTRNLNFNITRNEIATNQLNYFTSQGMINKTNPFLFSSAPDCYNTSFPLEERARAYLDVNCAHCHNPYGLAKNVKLNLTLEADLNDTGIKKKKNLILRKMERGKMPKLGTTILDNKGIELIKEYIKSL